MTTRPQRREERACALNASSHRAWILRKNGQHQAQAKNTGAAGREDTVLAALASPADVLYAVVGVAAVGTVVGHALAAGQQPGGLETRIGHTSRVCAPVGHDISVITKTEHGTRACGGGRGVTSTPTPPAVPADWPGLLGPVVAGRLWARHHTDQLAPDVRIVD